jgi:glycosyltransferase involved in cell wall biosynthesis
MPVTADPSLATATPSRRRTPAVELSVVMPCLNEAATLAKCIDEAQAALRSAGIRGEIIVADNGSSDGSQLIAASRGARVVEVDEKGYGSALLGGMAAAQGEYILIGDADDSYDFSDIPAFVARLREGADLVMGNRFLGGIAPGAMPALHRYLGNPVLSFLGRLFFKSPCGDFHCGLRALSKSAAPRMDLRSRGMEFASEMVVKATLLKMRIAEVPTTLSPDGRRRNPHLRTWHDGWRHLRFLLLYSPRWLFLYPGLLLMLVGALLCAWLLPHPRTLGHVTFDVHTLLYAASAVLIGFQAAVFAILSKVFAISEGLLPEDPRLNRLFRFVKLETGLLAGAASVATGLAASLYAVFFWGSRSFGPLRTGTWLRVAIPSVLLLTLGCQTILSSFFLSILGMKRR